MEASTRFRDNLLMAVAVAAIKEMSLLLVKMILS